VSRSSRRRSSELPQEVAAIRGRLDDFLNHTDADGRQPNNAKCGVYVFYDYDGEPIYVGQTTERLRTRIRRHLTNQRTDAVAMNVLDPFEVAEVEVYPFYELESPANGETNDDYKQRVKEELAAAEYTVFQKVLRESALGAVLNEADIPPRDIVLLPPAVRARIIPDDIYDLRKHPDTRLARRAMTVANLARVISERDVSIGLRRTLITQARRLERLASQRLADFHEPFPVEEPGNDTGESELP
jgi:hypothetical protein